MAPIPESASKNAIFVFYRLLAQLYSDMKDLMSYDSGHAQTASMDLNFMITFHMVATSMN